MGFDKIWIRINQFHLAMATPFRRPYVSWRVVSSIGDLRGCTISGTRQHAGQAIAPIPRSSGDGPVEIQRRPISTFSRSISLYTGGYTQNGTFSEFCILSRHLDRFCSSKRPRGPRGPPELPNDKKTAAPRLLDRLLFRYPPPQIRLKWDVLSVTFNGKFQR